MSSPQGAVFMEHGRQPRVSARVAVGLKIGEQINMGRTRDISVSGVFVELDQPVPLGESVELFISHPDVGETLRLEGSVARLAPEGVGIYFQGLTPEQRTSLENFLTYLKREGAPPAPPSPPLPGPAQGREEAPPPEYDPRAIGDALEKEQQVREQRRKMASGLHESAKAALKSGDGARAVELLSEAIKLSPGVSEFHHDLGTAYYQTGEVERAVAEFDRALALQQGGD